MGRRTTIVGVAVAGLVALGAGVGGGVTALPGSQTERSRQAVADKVRMVRVDNESGSVRIVAGNRPSVTVIEHWLLARPDVSIQTRGDLLDIEASCPNVPLNECSVEFDITVPAASTAIVDVAAGSVEVFDLTGSHRLATSAGSVTAKGVGSRIATLEAKSSAGSVTLADVLAKSIEAVTSSGSVKVDALEFTESLLARTSSGSVEVVVAPGTYNINTGSNRAASRATVTGLTHDPKAPRSITATTSSGSVKVTARGAKPAPRPAEADPDDDNRQPPRSSTTTSTTTRPTTTTSSTTTSTTVPDDEGDDRDEDDDRDEEDEDDDRRGGLPFFP